MTDIKTNVKKVNLVRKVAVPKVDYNEKLDFRDVLIRPVKSSVVSRRDVSLSRQFNFENGQSWYGVPIVASNMDGVGTFEMKRELSRHGLLTCLVKSYRPEDYRKELCHTHLMDAIVSTGISDDDLAKTQNIISTCKTSVSFICIDVANGYTDAFMLAVAKARKMFPDKILIAGNVVTPERVKELFDAGVDIVKIGIGPGSVCTTRIKTGVGYPQLSAILECANVAKRYEKKYIMSDGGCTSPGDVAKAFGAGADFVMLGGMFAGHAEGGGTVITRSSAEAGKKSFVRFYGMSSEAAMNKHHGGVADYRASEGRVVEIPFRGHVEPTVKDLLGGIRSSCAYVGAHNLTEFYERTTFVRVQQQYNSVFAS